MTVLPRQIAPALLSVFMIASADHSAHARRVDVSSYDWVTIGDPGNPAFEGGPTGQLAGRGSVAYEYRLTQTEITVAQWFEFVQAYGPYAGEEANSFFLTGLFIAGVSNGSGGYRYSIAPGTENLPTSMSWRNAARFCNWLHNGKVRTAEAFEDGVYDVGTFTQNPDGTYNDQSTHSPGAQFWIPSLDEWIKGVHYDPNLNGGEGGWWNYPDGGNDPLTLGSPDVAQSNAAQWDLIPFEFLQVGSYPAVPSPLGLLDASGGYSEWTEEWHWDHKWRVYKGSNFLSDSISPIFQDHILELQIMAPWGSNFQGLRLASPVPAPAAFLVFGGLVLMRPSPFLRRRTQ
jgi:hypothetical protein